MRPAALIVSVHDVAPSTIESVKSILADLEAAGINRRVLKVIPNKDGIEDILRSPDLLTLLSDEAQRGSEVVQHGFTHRLADRPAGRWADRLRAGTFASDNAECLAGDRQAVVAGIIAGRRLLREAGVEPAGFCAPAWLAAPWLGDELKRAGFRFCVEMTGVRDLQSGRRDRLGWDGYMGSAGWQEWLTMVGAVLHARAIRRAAAVRVYFHPQRLPSPAYDRALRLVQRLAAKSRVLTFSEVLGCD